MNKEVMFSSKTDLWSTPQDLFDALHKEFNFTVDVCADETNHKCKVYYDEKIDGLKQEWTGVCWMNPPYGREIGKWIKKADDTAKAGHTVVALLPSRTATKWFHDYCLNHSIRFLKSQELINM